MLRVFLSHSSHNAWLLEGLIDLIRQVSPGADVFCSTEIPIEPGDNYKKSIFSHLESADVFVAIISQEYWKSRYCILELGAAYHRYCYDEARRLSIQPLLLPPLDKALALANTPLVEMQIADLTDSRTVELFLRRIAGPERSSVVDGMGVQISEYVAFVSKHVLEQLSLVESASVNAYYEEFPGNDVPKEQVVRCQKLADEQGFLFEFRLSRVSYTPSFASVALEYWKPINLMDYLRYDRDAQLCFVVDNMGGALGALTVELKYEFNHQVYHSFDCELHEGENAIALPLGSLEDKPLDLTNQICFVVHPRDSRSMNAPDGNVVIRDIRVDFSEKNLFDLV